MTSLSQFFTFPWIKILLQEYLYCLNTQQPLGQKKPFRAYIKEVYEGGFLLTDGFNECRCKLQPNARTYLKDRYPNFCQLKNDSI
jgi:hypothetical protein